MPPAEVEALLQRLPPRQRAGPRGREAQGDELGRGVAAVSGQSVGALKVNTHRALKTLRALFQDVSPNEAHD